MPATVGVCRCGHPHEHLGDRPGYCSRAGCECTVFRPQTEAPPEPADKDVCRCGHYQFVHTIVPDGSCAFYRCHCIEFRSTAPPDLAAAAAHYHCPACGEHPDLVFPDAPPTMTIEDSEGYRWHTRCVVDLLPSVRGLVAKAGLDVGRK